MFRELLFFIRGHTFLNVPKCEGIILQKIGKSGCLNKI